MHFTGAKIFALDYVVVNTQIKLTHYDETKKMTHDPQIIRAKENLKLSYGGPILEQSVQLLLCLYTDRFMPKLIPIEFRVDG